MTASSTAGRARPPGWRPPLVWRRPLPQGAADSLPVMRQCTDDAHCTQAAHSNKNEGKIVFNFHSNVAGPCWILLSRHLLAKVDVPAYTPACVSVCLLYHDSHWMADKHAMPCAAPHLIVEDRGYQHISGAHLLLPPAPAAAPGSGSAGPSCRHTSRSAQHGHVATAVAEPGQHRSHHYQAMVAPRGFQVDQLHSKHSTAWHESATKALVDSGPYHRL